MTVIYVLGEILNQYLLTCKNVIPQRVIDKINQLTMSMVEHGFDYFYDSINEFSQKRLIEKLKIVHFHMRGKKNEEDDQDLQPVTVEQLWPVIYIILSLNGIATIIFVAEILYSKWQNWRNCKYRMHC